jgi:adenylate cyclase
MVKGDALAAKKAGSRLQIFFADGGSDVVFLRKTKTTIGRVKDNDIVLPDPRISRYHSEVEKEGQGFVIKDLGSHNQVRVNGQKIKSVLLKDGDEIRIGPVKLVYLTGRSDKPSLGEGVVIEKDEDLGQWNFQTIQVKAEDCSATGLESVIIPPRSRTATLVQGPAPRPDQTVLSGKTQELLSSLERTNKILFVLYEISRQLTAITDHTELFRKVMDLVFKVIDADYGFLILVDPASDEEFVPVVVKFRDATLRQEGQVKASRTLINKVINDRVALLTSDALADSRFVATESLIHQKIRSSLCVPLWKSDRIIGVIQLNSTKLGSRFQPDDLELLKSIGCQMSMVLEQVSLNEKIKEEERLRSWLSRYHSPQIIEALLEAKDEADPEFMEAKEQEATILFADIIGFTRISEAMSPREVNRFLNEYFTLMTDIVFEHDGTLDKYVGDGVMAVFGAPLERKDDAERAVRAALSMRRKLEPLMTGLKEELRYKVRIGINTGHVVAGNIGSPKRLDYTVIGDTVNIASRLEALAEPNQILVGEETYRRVAGKFKFKGIGSRQLRGRSSRVNVYEVLDK